MPRLQIDPREYDSYNFLLHENISMICTIVFILFLIVSFHVLSSSFYWIFFFKLSIRCTRIEVLPFLGAYLHSGLAFSAAGSNFCQAKVKQKFDFSTFHVQQTFT